MSQAEGFNADRRSVRSSCRLSGALTQASRVPYRVRRFEEAEDFGKVVGAEDRGSAIPDEQVRTDGGDTVNVARDGLDGHSVVEGDSRCDQSIALQRSFDDEQDI